MLNYIVWDFNPEISFRFIVSAMVRFTLGCWYFVALLIGQKIFKHEKLPKPGSIKFLFMP
jgi:hypothetical protein